MERSNNVRKRDNLQKFFLCMLKYIVLFGGVYVCSVMVLNIFAAFGMKFKNMWNTAFVAALAAVIFLQLIIYNIRGNKGRKANKINEK